MQLRITKRCPMCKVEKSAFAFNRCQGATDGLASYCRECGKKQRRQWKIDNSDRELEKHLKGKYGLSLAEYRKMSSAQNGLCAICSLANTRGDERLCVDHDHASGQVRGLICHTCNVSLGLIKDDISTLRNMITYLEHHGC